MLHFTPPKRKFQHIEQIPFSQLFNLPYSKYYTGLKVSCSGHRRNIWISGSFAAAQLRNSAFFFCRNPE